MTEQGHGTVATEANWEQYWDWFAVALYLLLSVDLLMSIGAAIVSGLDAEANPIMRWVLSQGIVGIIMVHVLVLVLAVAGFALLLRYGQRLQGRSRTRFMRSTELWLGFLIAIGLLAYANNLTVIVLGQSLL